LSKKISSRKKDWLEPRAPFLALKNYPSMRARKKTLLTSSSRTMSSRRKSGRVAMQLSIDASTKPRERFMLSRRSS
jgi:hypothetical protein